MRRRIDPKDQDRNLHHFFVIETVAVKPVLSEALSVIGANDDGRGAAPAFKKVEQFSRPRIKKLGAGDLACKRLLVERPRFLPYAPLIEYPPRTVARLERRIRILHPPVTIGAVRLAV